MEFGWGTSSSIRVLLLLCTAAKSLTILAIALLSACLRDGTQVAAVLRRAADATEMHASHQKSRLGANTPAAAANCTAIKATEMQSHPMYGERDHAAQVFPHVLCLRAYLRFRVAPWNISTGLSWSCTSTFWIS